MPLVNVASSLPTSILMQSVPPAPGTEPELVYTIVGQRGAPAHLTDWGITYAVDEDVYAAYVAAHPDRAGFLKIVTDEDIDAMAAAETDPANYGWEPALAILPPSPAMLAGGRITDQTALLAVLRPLTDAGFAITIDGTAYEIIVMDNIMISMY